MVGSVARQRGFRFRRGQAEPLVILDIDEDYFATSDTIIPLRVAGWSNETLGQVDAILMQLCSPTEEDESFLAAQIEAAVLTQRRFLPSIHADEAYGACLGVDFKGRDTAKFVCASHDTPHKSVYDIFTELQAALATIQQTHSRHFRHMRAILLRTGFAVTPRSERGTNPEFPAPMAICTGVDQVRGRGNESNYQTNRLVLHHTPSVAALDALLKEFRLYLLMSGIGPYVRLVTLVRSIRDGYLPRHLWRRVETYVLETLAILLPNSEVIMDGRPRWD